MSDEDIVNLRLDMPGNPRYQPESMIPYFGYDNLAEYLIEVEWALLEALGEIGVMPIQTAMLLTDDLRQRLIDEITTTLQDKREKTTKHDIRALVQLMQEIVPEDLQKWIHFGATSYDIIDNARILSYVRAFDEVTLPALWNLISLLSMKVEQFISQVQIGRTHGQHALPITVGFWLATLLERIIDSTQHLMKARSELVGKFSGAVGAYNAQEVLDFNVKSDEKFGVTFEQLVLYRLGLEAAPISTQIVPVAPLTRFLGEYVVLSAVFEQFGRDCRNLQRTEIGEVAEVFDAKQVGSSTMPHKRNPITFENLEGIFRMVRAIFLTVLDSQTSEHQRDLTSSSEMRNWPGIVVLCQYQIERISPVVLRATIDVGNVERNLKMSGDLIMAELLYLALQLYGYEGDAHELVNHELVADAKANRSSLMAELRLRAESDQGIGSVVARFSPEILSALENPAEYTGLSTYKALQIVQRSGIFLKENEDVLFN